MTWTSEETSTTATVTAVTGAPHYRVNSGSWQASNIFPGLAHLTEYTFRARKAQTTTLNEVISPGFVSTSPDSTPPTLPDNENITYIYDLPGIGANATPCEINGLEFTHIEDKRAVDPLEHNTYAVTKIGNQCWMANNLAYTGNGCLVSEGTAWNSTAPFNACDVNGGTGWDQNEVLYQWGAAMDGNDGLSGNPVQGLCPVGWVLPSDNELTALTNYLSANSQYWCGGVSTQIGKALASTSNWNTSATACHVGNDQSSNNLTGLSVNPVGYRYTSGTLYDVGLLGFWWSSTPSSGWTFVNSINASRSDVTRGPNMQAGGNSVRCLLGS